jgi:hypothetical protein
MKNILYKIDFLKLSVSFIVSVGIFIFLIFPMQAFDIKITATGQKNAESGGSEVWILNIIDGDYSYISKSSGWLEKRDGRELVSISKNQPSSIVWRMDRKDHRSLSFLNHPWSGIVELSYKNNIHKYDLFKKPSQKLDLDINDIVGFVSFFDFFNLLLMTGIFYLIFILTIPNKNK